MNCYNSLLSDGGSIKMHNKVEYFERQLKNLETIAEIYPFIFNDHKNREQFSKFESGKIN